MSETAADFAVERHRVPHPSVASTGLPALLLEPHSPRVFCALAHGAGAGMEHRLMERSARTLAEAEIATLRYEFPYMAAGRRRPDRASVLEATVAAAVEAARALRPELPLVAGGRSMGGRMTARAQAEGRIDVAGLIFLAFPLHPPGQPNRERARQLAEIHRPMLFVTGSRDKMADLDLLQQICGELSERATLHVVDGADHSFAVLKRSRRTAEEVDEEIATAVRSWVASELLR